MLERQIEHVLKRPVGRPSRKPEVFYHSFQSQAKSWRRPRRVVAKVEWHQRELFPRVGFIVTNLTWRSKRVVRFYNGRGTAEQRIKEGKNAVKRTKLSRGTFNARHRRVPAAGNAERPASSGWQRSPWLKPGATFYLAGGNNNSKGNGIWDDVAVFDVALEPGDVRRIMDFGASSIRPGDVVAQKRRR